MKKRGWILGGILGVLALAGVAIAQLPNTLSINSAASTVAPSIRAAGIDANVSINLVPKGSGTVQINGAPIVTSGGTFTSLNVNPGPLNVTGQLFLQPGAATGLKLVGNRIFHTTTDAPTVGTTLETLYTFIVPANTLSADGQQIRIQLYLTTAANGNNKTILATYGATTLFTTGAQAFNNDFMTVSCDIFRTSATAQKAFCFFNASELNAFGSEVSEGTGFTTPAETLSGAVTILVRGTTPSAAADLTARAMTVDWFPVGQ